MTNQNCNKFLTLLMGKCWHKWEKSGYEYHCSKCGIYGQNKFYPEPMNDPLTIIRFMEKEMPEVLEAYLMDCGMGINSSTQWLTIVLTMENLITYLSDHREWGEKECPNFCLDESICEEYCKDRKRVHPALLFGRMLEK